MAQFPFDVDWPRPRLVRCVSCVTTVVLVMGAFDVDAEADEEILTTGGAASEPE